MNSLEFIKQHVTEWPDDKWGVVRLRDDGFVIFGSSPVSDLSEHFAPDYYDGKVWTREEFESVGVGTFKQPDVHWDNAPEWATSLGVAGSDERKIWYNDRTYQFVNPPYNTHSFDVLGAFRRELVTHIMNRPTPAPSFDNVTHNEREREITDRQGNSATVDAYDVIIAFGVTCPATQDAIKELLYAGDLSEARDSITRAIELLG